MIEHARSGMVEPDPGDAAEVVLSKAFRARRPTLTEQLPPGSAPPSPKALTDYNLLAQFDQMRPWFAAISLSDHAAGAATDDPANGRASSPARPCAEKKIDQAGTFEGFLSSVNPRERADRIAHLPWTEMPSGGEYGRW